MAASGPTVYQGQVLQPPNQPTPCGCPEMAVGHWCGHPQPCCTARRRTPWPGARNLNHLPICHERCWRRDAITLPRRLRAEGRNAFGAEDPTNTGEHLRLCHRRCYVQDLMRVLDDPEGEASEWAEREFVPCNQTVAEVLWFPAVQHWMVKVVCVKLWGARWQRPRHDHPWPWWFGEEEILGGEEREREKWMVRRAREEEGKAAAVDGAVEVREKGGWWAWVRSRWPPFRRGG